MTYRLTHIPPSTNHLFRNIRGKGRVKTREYMTWLNAAGWELKTQHGAKVAGPYRLVITVPLAWRKRKGPARDLDNFLKATIDALHMTGCTPDDRHMMFVSIGWGDVDALLVSVAPDDPRAEVTIECIDQLELA